MEYIALEECATDIYQAFLERGWRRFGLLHFRPVCGHCVKCESLRIPVCEFEPTKSMRKVYTKNKNTKITIERPSVSEEKIELYKKYHKERSDKKGWDFRETGQKEYTDMLVSGGDEFAYEICYHIDGALAGVDYMDVGVDGVSAVYFIANPDFAKYSLGVFSLLIQIEFAKKLGLKYVYLGYGVRENKSLNYKYKYTPLEILEHPSEFSMIAKWSNFDPQNI
jgi:leucyl-tRNA---protein transferase